VSNSAWTSKLNLHDLLVPGFSSPRQWSWRSHCGRCFNTWWAWSRRISTPTSKREAVVGICVRC